MPNLIMSKFNPTYFLTRLAACGAILLAAALLPSCGGGGGDEIPYTIRPKTLDGLSITLDANVTLTFLRNTGTSKAILTGDEETGTFIYSRAGDELNQYPNLESTTSDTKYPDDLNNTTYRYRAINDNSGVITLQGTVNNDLIIDGGGFNADNGSFTFLFESDSDGNLNDSVTIDVTFTGDGAAITLQPMTVRITDSTAPNYDTVFMPGIIRLTEDDSDVPENYNPDDPSLPKSKISPETLEGLFINFVNGIPDEDLDFDIRFVDAVININKFEPGDIDESGTGLLNTQGAAVDQALSYTWRRIDGTDDGELILSGIPAPNETLNGSYILSFNGLDNGDYLGSVDVDTPTVDEVSGTFTVPDGL